MKSIVHLGVALGALAVAGCPQNDLLTNTRGIVTGNGGGGGAANLSLAFTVQPSGAAAGNIITPPIQVTVRDSLGNPDSSFASAITVAIAANPTGGTLTGTRSVTPSNGVALFGDLVIDKTGSGYTLTASAPGATGSTSASFNIQ